jgi:hypothetical protein
MNPFHSIPFHDLTDGLLKQKEEHSTKKKKEKKTGCKSKSNNNQNDISLSVCPSILIHYPPIFLPVSSPYAC